MIAAREADRKEHEEMADACPKLTTEVLVGAHRVKQTWGRPLVLQSC